MRDRVSRIETLIRLMSKKLNINTLVVTAGNKGSFAYSKKRIEFIIVHHSQKMLLIKLEQGITLCQYFH